MVKIGFLSKKKKGIGCKTCGCQIEKGNKSCLKCHRIDLYGESCLFGNAEYDLLCRINKGKTYKNIIEAWDFIWEDAIQIKGLKWYIEARDKLIKKLDIIKRKQEEDRRKEKERTSERIDKWLKEDKKW